MPTTSAVNPRQSKRIAPAHAVCSKPLQRKPPATDSGGLSGSSSPDSPAMDRTAEPPRGKAVDDFGQDCGKRPIRLGVDDTRPAQSTDSLETLRREGHPIPSVAEQIAVIAETRKKLEVIQQWIAIRDDVPGADRDLLLAELHAAADALYALDFLDTDY